MSKKSSSAMVHEVPHDMNDELHTVTRSEYFEKKLQVLKNFLQKDEIRGTFQDQRKQRLQARHYVLHDDKLLRSTIVGGKVLIPPVIDRSHLMRWAHSHGYFGGIKCWLCC